MNKTSKAFTRRAAGRLMGGTALALAAGALGLAAPRRAAAQAAQNALTIGHISLRHLNPAIQGGNATGLPGVQIFAGLVDLDAEYQPVPYLAESWTISDDRLTFTFTLREGVVFHDGSPVTSEDVAFSLGIVRQYHGNGATMFGAVREVTTPDPRTVVIHLEHQHPAIFAVLSAYTMPVLPRHIYGEGDILTHPANLAPVGCGPFKFVEYVPDSHVTLEKFEDFFIPGAPKLDRLTFVIIRDAISSLIAVERGDIDYLPWAGIPLPNMPRVRSNANLEVTQEGYGILGPINYLEINLRRAPFDDVRVRKAIAHAMNKDFIADELLMGEARRLDGPMHSQNVFFAEDALVTYDYDLDRARALLDEAGLPAGADGKRFTATLRWYPEPGNINSQGPVAQFLRAQLAQVGVDIELVVSPDFATWAGAIGNWEFDLSMNATWNQADPTLGISRTYHSGNIRHGVVYTNTQGYENARVDELLDAAAREGDFDRRFELYAEFQRIISDELPVIHTNEEPLYTVHDRRLAGLPKTGWGVLAPLLHAEWS